MKTLYYSVGGSRFRAVGHILRLLALPLLIFVTSIGCRVPNNLGRPASVITVKTGLEVLVTEGLSALSGKRIGVVTNASGVNRQLESTIDLLVADARFNVTAIFTPEHGLRGTQKAGEEIGSNIDAVTGLPVYSLYGKTRRPTAAMLQNVDALIFDIQDVGSRPYTYLSTLVYVLQAADSFQKLLVVLDRPNPMGGIVVDGPGVASGFFSFTSVVDIPIVHGMTFGELALLLRARLGLDALDVRVVRMAGWQRGMTFRATGLPWVPTSPHIPEPETPFYFATTGLLGEMGTVSEGVGTTRPFHYIMHPKIDAFRFADDMNRFQLPGVWFQPVEMKPYYFRFSDTQLFGVALHISEPMNYMPVATAVYLLTELHRILKSDFRWFPPATKWRLSMVDRAWGSDQIRKQVERGDSPAQIVASYAETVRTFTRERRRFLLY